MKAIIGLGNPGREYERTRHNVGFMVLDRLAQNWEINNYSSKFQGAFAEKFVGTEKVILLKPQTYMNLSGQAVASLASFYKLEPQDLLVVYDDLDLAVGRIRIRARGSSGGHNGIKSIIGHLGSEFFPRLKMGIGRPPVGRSAASYVLEPFAKDEEEGLDAMTEQACEAIELWLLKGTTEAMNRFNAKS
ncbi:aminoacyl-tRNA hydrolase [Heliorestis convoluta]|uniref:Peptidyl-tRNA hydrolase n=1 Tax=Heliorestis convoluta TaxID=356322 RepID=A0A5Q2N092_9FIRM|nr:aminoacyl-tRNA hydrolase [Heliorestis convoluta]QGG48704.1 peptidyl-tRNA hydrolase [Heliorestis convoluta]